MDSAPVTFELGQAVNRHDEPLGRRGVIVGIFMDRYDAAADRLLVRWDAGWSIEALESVILAAMQKAA